MRRQLGLHGPEVVGGDGVALFGAQQVVEHAAPQQHRVGPGGGRATGPVHGGAAPLAAAGAHSFRAQQLHGAPHCGYRRCCGGVTSRQLILRERPSGTHVELQQRRVPESQ